MPSWLGPWRSGDGVGAGASPEMWPLSKIAKKLDSVGGKPPKAGYAVLVTTGAMNPPHRGHLQLLRQAHERLEAHGYCVLGAWMSPSHDGYVQPKAKSLGTPGLSAPFRLEAAERTAADDDIVSVGRWEATFPGLWPDFPKVHQELKEHLAKVELLNGLEISVFYACGTDHAEKCGLYRGRMPVVVVPRAGEEAEKENPPKVFVAEPAAGEVATFSSTLVRKALSEKDFDFVSSALSPEAARFLLRPTEAELERFRADYAKIGIS